MDANLMLKYKKYSTAQLKNKATKVFNAFIRERDKEKGCISCGGKVEQAGHFYSAGHHPGLRYNENNVSGQCVRCNHFLRGNLINYREGLEKRLGSDVVNELYEIMTYYRREGYKWDRFFLIEIIEKYK